MMYNPLVRRDRASVILLNLALPVYVVAVLRSATDVAQARDGDQIGVKEPYTATPDLEW